MKRASVIMGVVGIFMLTTFPLLSKTEPNNGGNVSHEVDVRNAIVAVSGAELDISPVKATKTMTWTMNFLTPQSLEQRKQNLIRLLCCETGADIIIDPQFSYSKRFLGGGKLILTGYPAKYKNFRSLNETEIDSLVLKRNGSENTIIFIN